MDYTVEHKKNEQKDRRKSALITFLSTLLLFLLIFFYKFTKTFPKSQETVTTMLINFGDNKNGETTEEPANQEGSLAAVTEKVETKPAEQPVPEPKKAEKPKEKTEAVKEKILTGSNTKITAKKTEKAEKKTSEKSTSSKTKETAAKTKTTTKSTSATVKTSNSKTGTGDGKGTAAIGNLIKGRGTKTTSQGTGSGTGNAGDPLGGEGNGDSRIGVDRKLIGFIPGTMGRGGAQPSHNCSAAGSITIAYTVDKAGNVVSARRSSGSSDPCIVSTTVSWVKQYVKAEKANVSSTGTYKITF